MPWGWVWLGGALSVGFYAGAMLMEPARDGEAGGLGVRAGRDAKSCAHAARPIAAQETSMSQRDVERALGRLVTDEEFRHEFYHDPRRACVGLGIQLTEEEIQALLATRRSALAVLAECLDDRICRLHLPCLVSRANGAQGTLNTSLCHEWCVRASPGRRGRPDLAKGSVDGGSQGVATTWTCCPEEEHATRSERLHDNGRRCAPGPARPGRPRRPGLAALPDAVPARPR